MLCVNDSSGKGIFCECREVIQNIVEILEKRICKVRIVLILQGGEQWNWLIL